MVGRRRRRRKLVLVCWLTLRERGGGDLILRITAASGGQGLAEEGAVCVNETLIAGAWTVTTGV